MPASVSVLDNCRVVRAWWWKWQPVGKVLQGSRWGSAKFPRASLIRSFLGQILSYPTWCAPLRFSHSLWSRAATPLSVSVTLPSSSFPPPNAKVPPICQIKHNWWGDHVTQHLLNPDKRPCFSILSIGHDKILRGRKFGKDWPRTVQGCDTEHLLVLGQKTLLQCF